MATVTPIDAKLKNTLIQDQEQEQCNTSETSNSTISREAMSIGSDSSDFDETYASAYASPNASTSASATPNKDSGTSSPTMLELKTKKVQTKILNRAYASEQVCDDSAHLCRSNSESNLPSRPSILGHRQLSNPVLTKPQQGKIHRHRSILLVKTLQESITPEMDDSTRRYIENRRRRRKTVIGGGVTFSHCDIREHAITLGDNPGGTWGPPLSLGWEYFETITMSLDDFEAQHPPRRIGAQMVVPKSVREEMLRHAGFSRGEIQVGVKLVNIARNQRKRTGELLQLTSLHELAEKVKRGTRNALFRRQEKKGERTYLERAMEVHRAKVSGMQKSLCDKIVASEIEKQPEHVCDC